MGFMRKGRKMFKKKSILYVLLCMAILYVPMHAAGNYQTKKVQYMYPNFYYNGVPKSLSAQPVLIDGKAYLPLRALCDATGLGVVWQGNNLSVTNNNGTSTYSAQAQLQAKEYEIASLKQELQNLKNQMGIVSTTTSTGNNSGVSYTQTTGKDIIGTELTATRKDLDNSYADYFEDIDFDFSVNLSSNKVKVSISYDSSSENKAFNKLSNREVKNFITDVCEKVRDHHDDIVITGTIKYNSTTKYSFTYSKRDELSYSTGSSSSSSDDDITESRVEKIVRNQNSVEIDGYSKNISIEKADAYVSESRERAEFYVYIDISGHAERVKAWNDYLGTDNNTDLRSDMKAIANEIEDETDYDIYGKIYDYSTGKLIGQYDYDDNEIVTYKIS